MVHTALIFHTAVITNSLTRTKVTYRVHGKYSPSYIHRKSSSQFSQEADTEPCFWSHESIPYFLTHFVVRIILISSSHLRLRLPRGVLNSRIQTKMYAFFRLSLRSVHPAHLILIDLITLIILVNSIIYASSSLYEYTTVFSSLPYFPYYSVQIFKRLFKKNWIFFHFI
jgi:hypothetical protein